MHSRRLRSGSVEPKPFLNSEPVTRGCSGSPDRVFVSIDAASGAATIASNAWITLALREGKNREVRRVLERLGLPVTRLIRLSFGPFQLGNLARGEVAEVPRKVLAEQLGTVGPVHADRRR